MQLEAVVGVRTMGHLLREATGGEWSQSWRKPRLAADSGGRMGICRPRSSCGATFLADADGSSGTLGGARTASVWADVS